jgi:hypothetical protein
VTSGIRFAVLLAILAGCTSGPPEPPRPSAPPDWSALPDFDALRREWGDRDDFMQLCEFDRPLRMAGAAMDASAWEEVLRIADSWLARCVVDIDFHAVRANALQELGRTAEFEQQLRWRDGLLESILRTGDGKTEETAWVVISVAEEYSVLNALGLRRETQSLTTSGRDRIEAEVEGRVVTLYFFPDAHFRRLEKAFGGP